MLLIEAKTKEFVENANYDLGIKPEEATDEMKEKSNSELEGEGKGTKVITSSSISTELNIMGITSEEISNGNVYQISTTDLEKMGIKTIGDLAGTDQNTLIKKFGKFGKMIWEYANGIDNNPVTVNNDKPKGIGNSLTLPQDVANIEKLEETLLALTEQVAYRLRKQELLANVVNVQIKTNDFKTFSHQRKLDEATDSTKYLYKEAKKLLETLYQKSINKQIRLIGVRVDNLEEKEQMQISLFNQTDTEKEKQRKLDLLRYQLNEIQEARLKEGEESELEERSKIIRNSEKIAKNLSEAEMAVGENTIDLIGNAIRALEKIEDVNSKYSEKLVEMKNIYYEVQEVARDISSMKEDIYFDERERNEIEERLDEIYSLKKKYGNTIEKILDYKEELEKEIDRIENLDEENRKTKEKIEKIVASMEELCKQMEELRKKNSKILNEKINEELVQLEMKNARFNAKVIEDGEFSINGKSHVEFVITTNLGEEEKKLNKIASGGEMSRIMLAIKTVLSDIDEVPVLIFDEIDTGISGKAANSVGSKLKKIAKKHQVIIVTHLATIAAQGDYNYYIYKEVDANKTNTNVKLLNESETIREIARIASGEITEISLSHARELRNKNV